MALLSTTLDEKDITRLTAKVSLLAQLASLTFGAGGSISGSTYAKELQVALGALVTDIRTDVAFKTTGKLPDQNE